MLRRVRALPQTARGARRRPAAGIAAAAIGGACASAWWEVSCQRARRRRAPEPAPEPAGQLVIEDHRVGEGAEAAAGETVHIHYEGRLGGFDDGAVFDSSYERGAPLVFQLDESPVIAGFHEGVQGMKVGGRRKLTIPSRLAYGAEGVKDPARPRWLIPPHATLFFR